MSFLYEDFNEIKKITLSNNNSYNVSKEYDCKQRMNKLTLKNGTIYEFKYDSHNNIREIKLNGTIIYRYSYNMQYNLLTNIYYGNNGDSYEFEYDSRYNLSAVKYKKSNETNYRTLYRYQYQDNKLWKILDSNNNVEKEYQYDINDNIINIISANNTIHYQYDSDGNFSGSKQIVASKTISKTYCQTEMSKEVNPDELLGWLHSKSSFMASIFKAGNANLYGGSYAIAPNVVFNGEYSIDSVVPMIKITNDNVLCYKLSMHTNGQRSGSVGFWFKADSNISYSNRRYLFSSYRPTGTGKLEVYINTNKRIVVDLVETNGTVHNGFIISDDTINLNKWNFFSLNFMRRYDGIGYSDVSEYALTLNEKTKFVKNENPSILLELGLEPIYNIGFKGDSTNRYSLDMNIAALFVGCNCEQPTKLIDDYYQKTREYIIENEYNDNTIRAVDFSETNIHLISDSINNQFDIYPLQNNFKSLNDNMPTYCNLDSNSFKFNHKNKLYCYDCNNSELEFNNVCDKSGTILVKAYSKISNEKQYIFDLKDSNNHRLALVKCNNILYVDCNNTLISTGITEFTDNAWHTVGFSFDESITHDSGTNTYKNIRVYFDGRFVSIEREIASGFGRMKLSVGRKMDAETSVHELGIDDTYLPFNGQMGMLVISDAYCYESLINTLISEINDYTSVTMYDQLGMLAKTEITHNDNTILSTDYVDNNETENEYKMIKNEVIKFNNTTVNRTYIADKLGRVKRIINSSLFANHYYQYDERGFLTNENGSPYTYDENGNIKSKSSRRFEYDSVIKGRLTSVDGNCIYYTSSNPLNPTVYKGNTYKY